MKSRYKNTILALGLLASGGLRLGWETSMTRELRADGLLAKPVKMSTRDKIGQTSAVVVLGGLRTLVATFCNLRAYNYFEQNRWSELAETYELIVDLAPNTIYYWDTGGYYLAYCAASHYHYDSNLPALRRREAWQSSIQRGRAFLERGAKQNPDDWVINAALGRILSDPNKILDFPAAAAAFKASADTGKALSYVRRNECLAVARIPGREAEALEFARRLYADPHNRVPVLCCVLLALECHADPSKNPMQLAVSIFGNARSAHDQLGDYWLRVRERYPLDGVASALRNLEIILAIPAKQSVFSRPPQQADNPEDWFRKR